ncbi:PIG-L deacetylase family protein [Tessaracoccus flavus]|uniref:GlcNAc-PI de-N-acetylase n=1 Tax=Tessaracoccus flavus TaxID=1610493 RepID=A0A1Q2CE33_9ACTN|nr:PIG-L deacetylase family protein [Tessaracoccus flavus]AQP44384.1 GlcNAc-PI de-N-acetylase [Tessaracoccus flavus]SDY67827.1 N-acetylglucosaminyl deacetylase, LmbE family [Tessaracoccus flavus]
MAPDIQPLSDDQFQRILIVVAHPDDVEYGMSACVHKWVARGATVAYLLLTSGEAGMQRPPAEVGPLRAAEQREACRRVGVDDLTILDHPDGVLEYSLALRRDVARRIREFRPDTVATSAFDVEVGWGLNQADHRVAGLVALDACRDADNTWVFPELAEEGLEKWGTRRFLVFGDPNPSHGVVLTREDVDAGIASLTAHEAYLADLPGHPAPEQFLTEGLSAQGEAMGVEFAALFRVHELAGPA